MKTIDWSPHVTYSLERRARGTPAQQFGALCTMPSGKVSFIGNVDSTQERPGNALGIMQGGHRSARRFLSASQRCIR